MQKSFGFAMTAMTLKLLLAAAASSLNFSDDLAYYYYDRQVHARTWVVPTESSTNGVIGKRHPAANVHHDEHHSGLKPLAPVATVELFRNKKGTDWLGKVGVGTPDPQVFNLMVDTASPYLWVTSSKTKSPGTSNTYNSRRSKSWSDLHVPFNAFYGAGSCHGSTGSDIVNVGGLPVEMSIGSVTERSKGVVEDGILGLSLSPDPKLSKSHFLYAAQEQYSHFNPIAAFCFGRQHQELHLGQVKDAYLSKEIEYHKVIKLSSSAVEFWAIDDGEISVDGTTIVPGSIQTIFDTGAQLIFGPPQEVEQIYGKIRHSRIHGETPGQVHYLLPCKHKAKVSFKWKSGDPLTILPEDLAIKIPGENYWCKGAIVGERLPYHNKPETLWLLGDVGMRGMYVIYNAKDRLLGLAEAKERCTRP